jgi:hypothetical protein
VDSIGKDTQALLVESALAQAKKNNLVCDDGTIICWDCKKREALLPSLHCPLCLAAAWQRLGITEPWCPNYEQEKSK